MMSEILVWAESNDQKRQIILDACEQRRAAYKKQYNKPY
jgi:predicted Fe-S protein YdhL (DUF1289 family)